VETIDLINQWQTTCERAVFNFSNLLHLSGRRQAGSAVLELLRGAPRAPEDLKKALGESLFSRCFDEVFDPSRKNDPRVLHSIYLYVTELAAMPANERAILEASVAGVFLGWGMGG
jgi:hypothetical protein